LKAYSKIKIRKMVRVNLINPKKLADQHLIAEYDEILMLLGYVKRYPIVKNIPKDYCLGKGHMIFFKNKLLYLKKRHELLKHDMRKRGFATHITIDLKKFSKTLVNDWKPRKEDIKLIKERIIWKINKKPKYYRYYHLQKPKDFFIKLLR
jgi:deoxyribonuclease (pyrimidine dimer)